MNSLNLNSLSSSNAIHTKNISSKSPTNKVGDLRKVLYINSFTDIENKIDDELLLCPIVETISGYQPKPLYFKVSNALSELNTKKLKQQARENLEIEDIYSVANVTTSELYDLIQNNSLIPGKKYRITDYIPYQLLNTEVEHHRFDIILEALSINELSSRGLICHNELDTYFNQSQLNKWEVEYKILKEELGIVNSENCFINSELYEGNNFIYPINIEAIISLDSVDTNIYNLSMDFIVAWDRDSYYFNGNLVSNLLCIYKTDTVEYPDAADYLDKFFYWGTYTVDGIIYDKWKKIDILYNPSSNIEYSYSAGENLGTIYILTRRLVANYTTVPTLVCGCITWMRDEFNNEAPYDFKNIKFLNNEEYTYTFYDLEGEDASLLGFAHDNIIKGEDYLPYSTFYSSADNPIHNNIIGKNYYNNHIRHPFKYNKIGDDCQNNTFLECFENNVVGNNAQNNTFEETANCFITDDIRNINDFPRMHNVHFNTLIIGVSSLLNINIDGTSLFDILSNDDYPKLVYFDGDTYKVLNFHTSLLNKVDKVDGKGLSTEDFTTELKQRLENLDCVSNLQLQTILANLNVILNNIQNLIKANTDSISMEADRAIVAEIELLSDLQTETERMDRIEPLVVNNGHAIIDLQHSVQDKDAEYRDKFIDLHNEIKVEVARAEGKELEIVNNIENGNIIAGQAREVYSTQGKADSAVFLARTQGGDATISDGVAELRQVGGNAIKVINSMENIAVHTNAVIEKYDNFITAYRSSFSSSNYGVRFVNNTYKGQKSHKYYSASLVYSDIDNNNIKIFINDYATSFTIKNGWSLVSVIRSGEVKASNDILQCTNVDSEELVVANHIFINLTEMYGAGNEPTLDECDKLFAVISYLPSGINVATPVIYESVGYNQCDTSKSMSAKTVTDGVITDGANTLVAMPCLPCKLGIGENNGYIIGNGDGEEWSDASIQAVYFTPFNPQETTGDIYLQKLEPQLCEQCNGGHNVYLPPCVGYLLIETTSTDKLCAHFAWSGDRDYRDYEPYIKTEVKLPQLTQMSEWGLAGITASGTAARDTIDLENKKYIKRIGRVNLGELSWRYSNAESTNYGYSIFSSSELKGRIKNANSGKFGNILTLGYTIAPTYALTSNVIPNKCIMLYINGALYIRDDAYTSVAELTAALYGQYLYYELAVPEVYSIDIDGNSYIVNDYGVEHFVGTSTPVNASQLFYKRSIVGETKNFLDRLYSNTEKDNANGVADYITSEINGNKTALNDEIARAEKAETFLTPVPNTYWRLEAVGKTSSLYSNTGYKSIIVPVREGDKFIITAEGDGYARTWGTLNLDKVVLRYAESYPQANAEVTISAGECYLVVNCEIREPWDVRITSTAADILQQFIAAEDRATKKAYEGRYLALRDLFVAAGALYNDTTATIMRTAPWGESVKHLAGHYYLNGLGDITEDLMTAIYNFKGWESLACSRRGLQSAKLPRTLLLSIFRGQLAELFSGFSPELSFYGNSNLEIIPFVNKSVDTIAMPFANTSSNYKSLKWYCSLCSQLRYVGTIHVNFVSNFGTGTEAAFYNCGKLEYVYLYKVKVPITLESSPLLHKDSLLYMINNAIPTSAITITLHPDAYARLAEDSEIVEALKEKNGYVDGGGNKIPGTLPEGASINLVSA